LQSQTSKLIISVTNVLLARRIFVIIIRQMASRAVCSGPRWA